MENYNAYNYQEYIEELEAENARLREENKRLAEIPHEQDLLYMQAYKNYQTWKEDYARLREAQRWIPVSERLPETNGEYLVRTKPVDDYRYGCPAKTDVQVFYEGEFRLNWQVTHWMPLPEPPEAD